MYHQLTLSKSTDTDTDTDTDTRVMKRQRVFQHPNVMAALPDALIQMLSDYLGRGKYDQVSNIVQAIVRCHVAS